MQLIAPLIRRVLSGHCSDGNDLPRVEPSGRRSGRVSSGPYDPEIGRRRPQPAIKQYSELLGRPNLNLVLHQKFVADVWGLSASLVAIRISDVASLCSGLHCQTWLTFLPLCPVGFPSVLQGPIRSDLSV